MHLTRHVTRLCGLALGALLLAACAQGPGHTRAAGTVGGTAAGAALGAALSARGHKTEGALLGGALGLIGGTIAGEAIAQDQERQMYGPPPPPVIEHHYYGPPPGYVVYGRPRYVVYGYPPPCGGYYAYP